MLNTTKPMTSRAQNNSTPVLVLENVVRVYHQAEREIRVLDGAGARLMPGEAVALVGPSGAGKSTLLHVAGLLETPDSGSIVINGQQCAGLDDDKRTAVRRRDMGFVYQFHQLLPEFSALENVAMPQMIRGTPRKAAEARASELLSKMGLASRLDHRPAQMSGGEQQRTAICRALANSPTLLLADEPTGNLDPSTSELVFAELMHLIRDTGVAALIATHNMDLAHRMDRVFRLEKGRLTEIAPGTA
ncbi:MAG: ABC transporter ATP-binding protein [Hyphomicrobiaceae bacterium]|nr:ABC transporter ATP-binding protein [Hyphomicrobiaceae bacterium]